MPFVLTGQYSSFRLRRLPGAMGIYKEKRPELFKRFACYANRHDLACLSFTPILDT